MEQLGKTDLQLNDHMTGTGIPAPVFLCPGRWTGPQAQKLAAGLARWPGLAVVGVWGDWAIGLPRTICWISGSISAFTHVQPIIEEQRCIFGFSNFISALIRLPQNMETI